MDYREEMKQLRDFLNQQSYLYYVLDAPVIPDYEYDRLNRRLEELEAEHPEEITPDSPTQRVGDKILEGFETYEHPVPLESLQDVFNAEEVSEFLDRMREALGDGAIIALSAPVFSIENALYAAIAMYICGKVIDAVVDGPRAERAAYIISERHAEIANAIMYDLNRGCTELQARGVWSGNDRPVLFCVLGRSQTPRLKQIVSEADPEAIVIISEVHEAFGEGFGSIEG